MAELPSGTITFLFTDIEGSTALLKRLGDRYAGVLAAHRQLLRQVVSANGGHEMGTDGDAMFFSFPRVRQAIKAAADSQRALVGHEWPGGERVRVRIGLHTGEPEVVESEYIGMGLHRAARVSSAAHGGQVLLSNTTAGVVADESVPGCAVRRLGEYRLKDMDEPELLYELVIAGLSDEFPPPRAEPLETQPPRRSRRRLGLMLSGAALVAGGGLAAGLVLIGSRGAPTGTTTSTRPPGGTTPRAEQAWFRAKFIPFPASRKREMAAYAKRHYGIDTWRLINPKVIVEHYSVTQGVKTTIDNFASDTRDSELGELPGDCAHFLVGRDGTVYQLVPTTIMCRHTVGLNYTAIGIEHIGQSDADILHNPAQLAASQRLTLWLMSRYRIRLGSVIGHNESLRSPYHRERYAPWRCQTHGDWTHPDMELYRRLLFERAQAEGLRSLAPASGIQGPTGSTLGC